MIKFFRKIRQQLMAENRFSKYLLYAIGEIVLVVIGILIALGINNWNQKRIEIEKETIAFNNLISDLEEQSASLKVNIETEKEMFKSGLYISEHFSRNKGFVNNDTLLSKLNLLGMRKTFSPIKTTFDELKSTGNITLIRNENLKRSIIQFYDELERVSLITSYNNTNLVDGLYNLVLFEQTVYIHKFDYKEDYINQNFKNTRENVNRILQPESLEDLYSTSDRILNTPEKALQLFNLIQLRIQLANGQVIRYTED